VISGLPTVDVSLQAPQNVLTTLRPADIHPYVNLAGLGAGVHKLPIALDFGGNASQSVSNVSVDPPTVQVQLEAQATRAYTVTAIVSGTPAFGYGAEQAQVVPAQVSVTGSESAVNRIA